MTKEEIEKIFIAYYPPREQCVFSSGSAAVICKDILDQQTKELQEKLKKEIIKNDVLETRIEQLQAKIDELNEIILKSTRKKCDNCFGLGYLDYGTDKCNCPRCGGTGKI